jgi:predicted ribosome quality control (RQC) complex YloA/Tae2 family protein
MMGRYSNLIFVDKDGRVLDCVHRVTPDISSVRTVLPGVPYESAPSQGRQNPMEETREGFLSALKDASGVVAKVIPNLYTGFSRVTGEELANRAGVSGDTHTEALTEEMQERLADELCGLMNKIRAGEFAPCVAFEDGTPKEFSAFPLTIYPEADRRSVESISEALESFYDLRSRTALIRQRSQDLRQVVKTALERTAKKLDLQQEQFRDTEDREQYKVYGELLNTYGYGLQPGAKELTCTNYYDGQEITIPLDPTLTACENSKRYFEKYNKKKRTYTALLEQLETTRQDLEYLRSVSLALTMAENESDLAELRRELQESGYIRSGRSKKGKRKEAPARPLHFVTEDGYHIYVGKNNLQNEALTFEFASGNDMWFHAKQRPGSHVIVKREGREELPDHIYEIAAGLAAYYSSGQDAPKVEVDYTERRNLHKSPGQPKGFVIYHTNYSMLVTPDRTKVKEVSTQ